MNSTGKHLGGVRAVPGNAEGLGQELRPVRISPGISSRRAAITATFSAMELAEVTCPTCFEVFEVAMPHPDEMPAEVDYDCEVCCRPKLIVFTENEVYAKGLGD
jgi:hypothetical protein